MFVRHSRLILGNFLVHLDIRKGKYKEDFPSKKNGKKKQLHRSYICVNQN